MFAGYTSQSWRIEVENWEALERMRHADMMRLAGEHGAEWWGGGRFEFTSGERAFECASQARGRGLHARVILRVTTSSREA
jgi:hypothetical protein